MDFIHENNRIYLKNNKDVVIAQVSFPDINDELVDINHTFVDPSLRNQGIASMMMEAAVTVIQNQQKKAKLTCSYATKWFEEHPEHQDIIQ